MFYKQEQDNYDFKEGQVILIDKDLDWTSFDAVNKIRYIIRHKFNFKKIKVGHAGTLDPLATGLLIVCTGKFTKKIESYQAQEKEYITTIKLGETTPSFDRETEVDATFETNHITEELLNSSLKSFLGKQMQTAPAYSAKRVNGQRAYVAARKGEQVNIKSHEVVIHEIELLKFEIPFVEVRIKCGKGTYIRSFARDLGKVLGSGAHLVRLRRTKIGDFDVSGAMGISDFEKKIKNMKLIEDSHV